jgi:hypothetical protein
MRYTRIFPASLDLGNLQQESYTSHTSGTASGTYSADREVTANICIYSGQYWHGFSKPVKAMIYLAKLG